MSDPRIALKHGYEFPYDAEYGDKVGEVENSEEWAYRAARGVVADLMDRRKIKHGFEEIDLEIRQEIIAYLAKIIRLASWSYGNEKEL